MRGDDFMEYQGRVLRHELKYAINDLEYTYLKSKLKAMMDLDINVGESKEYHIRSLYFDDLTDSAFTEKVDGVFQRKKYRIRIYNKSDQLIRLELKEKFDSYVAKTSRIISRSFFDKILSKQLKLEDVKQDPFLLDFYLEMKMNLLEPKVIVDYIREPFAYFYGNVRVTFDKALKAAINTNDIFKASPLLASPKMEGTMILEVKYDDFLPAFIHAGLKISRHQHMALSKYTLCRELKNSLNWKERLL